MFSGPQRSKRRDAALSTLDGVIQVLSVAKDTCGVPPAQIALGSACVLLTTIKDTMGNKDDYVNIGLTCAEVCRVLDQGLKEMESEEPGTAVVDAIDRLKATMADIEGKIIEKNERNVLSRALHAKSDKDAIAAWEQEFNKILHIFNTELHIGVIVGIKGMRRDLSVIKEGVSNKQYLARTSASGEPPPPAPKAFFGRDPLIEELVVLAEKFKPIALIGAGGIGKTSIALTVLHHDRIKHLFDDNRRFIRCDKFTPSLPNFLAQLSKVIGAGIQNPKDLTSLQPFLPSKMILFLDNAELILDPQGIDAREIYAVVEELCRLDDVCLAITSRIHTVPPHCKRPTIPTLSMESACEIFYSIYDNGGQSDVINDLVRRLDFHALSITLLATVASHNTWDYDQLAEEWDVQREKVLRTDYNQSLAATIELSLTSPTFHILGRDARELLGVIAFFPQGINRSHLGWLFPEISDIRSIFDKFCSLSLTHRSNNFITMLAPIRDYLAPHDPTSSPLLCAAKDHFFTRLSVDVHPDKPGFEATQWIVSEDVNVEHLLDVFASVDANVDDVWDACGHFMEHLSRHKPRKTVLGARIEGLPDDHPSKPKCLFHLAELFSSIGNHIERKRLLTRTLNLEEERGNRPRIALVLKRLSDANRWLYHCEEGIQQAKRALEIYEQLGDVVEQADSLNILAYLLFNNDELDAAENFAFRAINLVPDKGQELLVCKSHRYLGLIYQWKGEKEEAIHHFETALGIASRFTWHDQLFWNQYFLAELFLHEDELDKANIRVGEAKSHATNDAYKLARAMETQAEIWYGQCKVEDARLEVSRALEVLEKFGATEDEERCRNLLRRWDER